MKSKKPPYPSFFFLFLMVCWRCASAPWTRNWPREQLLRAQRTELCWNFPASCTTSNSSGVVRPLQCERPTASLWDIQRTSRKLAKWLSDGMRSQKPIRRLDWANTDAHACTSSPLPSWPPAKIPSPMLARAAFSSKEHSVKYVNQSSFSFLSCHCFPFKIQKRKCHRSLAPAKTSPSKVHSWVFQEIASFFSGPMRGLFLLAMCMLVHANNLINEDYFDNLDFHLQHTLRAPFYPGEKCKDRSVIRKSFGLAK